MNKKHSTCAIVGAGIAGIAAAIRMACKGFEVDIFESNPYPGGKLSEIRLGEYRFDAGPSLFTMPHFVDELFELSGKNPRDYFDYSKLEMMAKYFYEDGLVLRSFADPEKFAAEIAQKTKTSPKRLKAFMQKSKLKYELTEEVFLKSSLHRLQNYFRKSTLRGILNMYRLDVFRSLDQVNRAWFEDPKMVQFFNRYATYNGSNPYETPGIMNVIPHLEFGFGAFFPKGGMYQITQSLFRLAKDLGVRFHFNTQVEEIMLAGKKAQALRLNPKTGTPHSLNFDLVISNMDIVNTYRKLLPGIAPPEKLLNQPKSSSALIFYWGIQGNFPELELHNIFFSQDYKKEFDTLFYKKEILDDPTVYLNISSKEAPEDAPANGENWFTMVNAPNNQGQDWDKIIASTRQNIFDKLSRILGKAIEPLIREEAVLDPRSIESRTYSTQGALYGNSSNNRYAAFLRHANFSSRIKNLYFCGGSVHPGGGIPLCLLSAKIATDLIKG
ncbi:MAG: 1-hydroxycarotenoid 3,4-desaturase CrtD [Microscillaceae bacterium]|nr:1-hydroxycarotenoid 3,4-desaturase CrtD [Microscillaceae bacterium]